MPERVMPDARASIDAPVGSVENGTQFWRMGQDRNNLHISTSSPSKNKRYLSVMPIAKMRVPHLGIQSGKHAKAVFWSQMEFPPRCYPHFIRGS
jgi:hypothetical protein